MKGHVKSRVFSVIIGLLFLAACGALVAALVLDETAFLNQLLKSWWTLFLIIPGLLGLCQRGTRISSFGLLLVGCGLLIKGQGWFGGILDNVTWWHMILIALLLVIGLSIICSAFGWRCHAEHDWVITDDDFEDGEGGSFTEGASGASARGTVSGEAQAIFSEQSVNMGGAKFSGGEFSAIFGQLRADMRGAVIERDCALKANSIFGEMVIYRAEGVNYKVSRSTVFGEVKVRDNGVENLVEGAPTVTIYANAIFGEIKIK